MAATLSHPPRPVAQTPGLRRHPRPGSPCQRRSPSSVYLLVLFVYPIFSTLSLSLKGDSGGFTLHWYADALTRREPVRPAHHPADLRRDRPAQPRLRVSSWPTRSPGCGPLWAALAMLVVVVPHFISALVRTYGWIIMLGDTRPGQRTLPLVHVPARRTRCSTTRPVWSSAPPR